MRQGRFSYFDLFAVAHTSRPLSDHNLARFVLEDAVRSLRYDGRSWFALKGGEWTEVDRARARVLIAECGLRLCAFYTDAWRDNRVHEFGEFTAKVANAFQSARRVRGVQAFLEGFEELRLPADVSPQAEAEEFLRRLPRCGTGFLPRPQLFETYVESVARPLSRVELYRRASRRFGPPRKRNGVLGFAGVSLGPTPEEAAS
jgi:hypothetical protein